MHESLKFGQIRLLVPMATDRVIIEKTVLPLAGNDDMHESSEEFEFLPDPTTDC